MTSEVRQERLRELGESSYFMLKQTYRSLAELHGMIDALHASCLARGVDQDFDRVEALKVVADRAYADLDRYLRPELDPDSAVTETTPEP